jgi:hypothetical protein
MIITITNKDGLNQISAFSDEKIKHITETNQWGHVIETILRDSNRENMKQTAVEWLAEYMMHPSNYNPYIERAKEIEKQQQGYSEEDLKEAFAMGSLNESIKDFNQRFKKITL